MVFKYTTQSRDIMLKYKRKAKARRKNKLVVTALIEVREVGAGAARSLPSVGCPATQTLQSGGNKFQDMHAHTRSNTFRLQVICIFVGTQRYFHRKASRLDKMG